MNAVHHPMEPAVATFLESLSRLLLSLERRGLLQPTLQPWVPQLLFSLSALQQIELRKWKLYSLLPSGFPPADDTAAEQRLHRAIQALKRPIALADRSGMALYYLNELDRYYAKKRSLFPRTDQSPGQAWLNPSLFPGSVHAPR